jgi:LysM repeat protein
MSRSVTVATIRQPRLRLTRRGRVVLIGLFLLLVATIAVVLSPAARGADPTGPVPTVVVQPGDTLWSVAAKHRPSRDPYAMIREIRRLNGMSDNIVHAGQELALPHEG